MCEELYIVAGGNIDGCGMQEKHPYVTHFSSHFSLLNTSQHVSTLLNMYDKLVKIGAKVKTIFREYATFSGRAIGKWLLLYKQPR